MGGKRNDRARRGVRGYLVEENEPRLISYSVYLDDDGRRMTVVRVHADPESLDHHMDVAGPRFGGFAHLVDLRSIQIYGEPSERAVSQLRDKVQTLGSGEVTVHPPHAGFHRPEPPVRGANAAG